MGLVYHSSFARLPVDISCLKNLPGSRPKTNVSHLHILACKGIGNGTRLSGNSWHFFAARLARFGTRKSRNLNGLFYTLAAQYTRTILASNSVQKNQFYPFIFMTKIRTFHAHVTNIMDEGTRDFLERFTCLQTSLDEHNNEPILTLVKLDHPCI